MKLNAHQRRMAIARAVQEHGMVRVAELTQLYQVTDTTIRRDLKILEEQNRLRRVHGGALANRATLAEQSFQEKARHHPEEKTRIGQAAARLINPNENILLDSGTTVLQVARHIPQVLDPNIALTVVTNSLPVVDELQGWNSLHLILLGGILLPEFRATVGPLCIADLRRIQVDKAFIGCDGLSLSHGLTTPHLLIAEVGRVMAEVAHEVIVVTDSSKLGRVGFTPIAALSAAHKLITDAQAPDELVAQVRASGVEVILV